MAPEPSTAEEVSETPDGIRELKLGILREWLKVVYIIDVVVRIPRRLRRGGIAFVQSPGSSSEWPSVLRYWTFGVHYLCFLSHESGPR
jgi:hypothetical protein